MAYRSSNGTIGEEGIWKGIWGGQKPLVIMNLKSRHAILSVLSHNPQIVAFTPREIIDGYTQ